MPPENWLEKDRSVVEKSRLSRPCRRANRRASGWRCGQRREQPFEFAVGFGGQREGDGGKLLFGQELVNAVAQPVADEEPSDQMLARKMSNGASRAASVGAEVSCPW